MRSSVHPWLILSCFLMSMLAGCQQLVWLPPTVVPTSIAPLSVPQLKYVLIESFGGMREQGRGIHFCDPDTYPVSVGDEPEKAMTQFPAIKNDAELFQAIIEHLALEGQTEFTTDDQVRIYREYKKRLI